MICQKFELELFKYSFISIDQKNIVTENMMLKLSVRIDY